MDINAEIKVLQSLLTGDGLADRRTPPWVVIDGPYFSENKDER